MHPKDGMARLVSPIQAYLESLHARLAGVRDGAVASYIPELAKANPDWFAICVATTDGWVYEVGDASQPFTIQSISKPLVYGLALEDVGREAVLDKIGVEPTGDAFNSISLAPGTGRPLNPMINAGAIAAASLVAGRSAEDKLDRLLTLFSLYAGRDLSLDRAVYESECETGHRNRAIGHMLRNFDILGEDPGPTLDLYFKQCSVSVTCRDLAVIGATLANGGTNPLTREQVARRDVVENVLSVMTTCGMYDYAGEWVYWVGMPAKSGVAGGVLAVLPGQLGLGVFSPPLDERGNSVRGVLACKEISRDFDLHFIHVSRSSRSALRAEYSGSEFRSKRRHDERENRLLEERGERVRVFELQGDVVFAAVESIARRLIDRGEGLDVAILDLKRVTLVDDAAAHVLADVIVNFEDAGRHIVLSAAQSHPRLLRFLEERLISGRQARLATFPDVDRALEWAENQILGKDSASPGATAAVPLAGHAFCRGLTAAELATLEAVLETESFAAGRFIVRRGEAADRIYLLVRGEVSVTLPLASGQLQRLATLSAGMVFGEGAAIERGERSADVRADTAVECLSLSAAAFDRLGETHPRIRMRLLENLLRTAARVMGRLNQEVVTLG